MTYLNYSGIFFSILLYLLDVSSIKAQEIYPFDTAHWDINAKAYVFEHYKGKDAVYLHQGLAYLKDFTFRNGTIEFDVYLTDRQSFPGVRFRIRDRQNMESFFLRPHLSGKPDANQAAPVINAITAWQLYFGPKYSFGYEYNFDGWTHIKLVVNEGRAQVFLDNSSEPHLSWELAHDIKEGGVAIGGSFAPVHYANFTVDKKEMDLISFEPGQREELKGVVQQWNISDKFLEERLDDPGMYNQLINERTWLGNLSVDEGVAANISRWVKRYDGSDKNTVFAKIEIESEVDQLKLFEFGYSDRVVILLNGIPKYKGTNKWRSRDYRYLGTIGLFDSAYLNLKKGKNTLLCAVSEDFGGWLITGRFEDMDGISIN